MCFFLADEIQDLRPATSHLSYKPEPLSVEQGSGPAGLVVSGRGRDLERPSECVPQPHRILHVIIISARSCQLLIPIMAVFAIYSESVSVLVLVLFQTTFLLMFSFVKWHT